LGKVYEVTSIQLLHFCLEAKETDLNVDDIDESQLWDISFFEDFKIRLVNRRGKAEIVDMGEWMERNGKRKKEQGKKCL